MTKQEAIQLCCRENNYKFPKELSSGILFYYGFKITIQEFNSWAKHF